MAEQPGSVNVVRLDVPFLTLTWFFVKASFAAALAAIVTSVIWIAIGVGMSLVGTFVLAAVSAALTNHPDQASTMPDPKRTAAQDACEKAYRETRDVDTFQACLKATYPPAP